MLIIIIRIFVALMLLILPDTGLLATSKRRISATCPEGKDIEGGYIKLKSTATCRCEAGKPDYPSRRVQWFNSLGAKIGRSGKSTTLRIPSGPNDIDKTYICKELSSSGIEEHGVDFSPKFIDPSMSKLSPSCPEGHWVKDGFIRIGTHATCTCQISSGYSPTGQVQWFNTKGEEYSPAGFLTTLIIPSGLNDKNANYACNGTVASKNVKSDIVFTSNLVGPVVNFQANNKSSLPVVVEEGSSVTFSCEVESIFPAIAVLVGPRHGQIQELRSQNQTLEFHLSNVTCEDFGRYECRGDEFKTPDSKQFVDVYMKCPIKTMERQSPLEFYFKSHQAVKFHIEVYGYPSPTEYNMSKEPGNGSDASSERYKINYIVDKFPFGMFTVEIIGKTSDDSTKYNLNVQNGVGKGVDIKFLVHMIKDTSSGKQAWFGITIIIGTVVFIVIIIITVISYVSCVLEKCRTSPTTTAHRRKGKKEEKMRELPSLVHRSLPEIPQTTEDPGRHYEEIPFRPESDYIDPI